MKKQLLVIVSLWCWQVQAQELFVVTEPASNMPAKSIGVRWMNQFMRMPGGAYNYHTMPELMWGINQRLMVHTQGFLSNREGNFRAEGMGFYGKYRFLSKDELHRHFRMAAFGRYSFNNSSIHQQEIETMGQNSGYELGLVATQLLRKTAISASLSGERALDNGKAHPFPATAGNTAINYSLSVGRLMHPSTYTNFKQTNVNAMVEVLAQQLPQNGRYYVDVVPSIQLIINSVARIDFGYRMQLSSNMQRTANQSALVKLEYNFFNVFR